MADRNTAGSCVCAGIQCVPGLALRSTEKSSTEKGSTEKQGTEKQGTGKSGAADSKSAVSPSDQPSDAEEELAEAAGPDAASVRPTRQDMLIASLAIFMLAVFVGFEVITKVPPTLHTPLMSGSNAISGITIVGALIVAGEGWGFASFLGFVAVIMATINVVGGFLVTHRMLAMFKKR